MKKFVSIVLALFVCLSFGLVNYAQDAAENPQRLYGDVNGSGSVNDEDVINLKRYISNWKVTADEEAADVNQDGELSDEDCILLKRAISGWNIQSVVNTPIPEKGPALNGTPFSEFRVVCPAGATTLEQHAAEYLSGFLSYMAGTEPEVLEASAGEDAYEILLRSEEAGPFQFRISTEGNKVVLSGRDFLLSGAAYHFANRLASEDGSIVIPQEGITASPQPEAAKKFILFIGDGMGPNHVTLLDNYVPKDAEETNAYFTVDQLPNQCKCFTHCADGLTDSAAAGTALATGWKARYQQVGYSSRTGKPVENLCELALRLNMTPAILTTDDITGATPAAFSAHVLDRHYYDEIAQDQAESGIDILIGNLVKETIDKTLYETLDTLNQNENGFFMMYEEAHIDKYSHDTDLDALYSAMVRANQALNIIMEYAMYNPDTVVIATADHETGNLQYEYGKPVFKNLGYHTGVGVPVYAYGVGTEAFGGDIVDNTDIAKFIGQSMGDEKFGLK